MAAPTADAPSPVKKGSAQRPLRVLHVVKSMGRGGLETWLMHAARNVDHSRYQFDFAVQESDDYDEELRSLGSEIRFLPSAKKRARFSLALSALLKRGAPYDVVHAHTYFYNSVVLGVARGCGVPVRVAHVHTGGQREGTSARRRAYEWAARTVIDKTATHGLGNSVFATESLFGAGWQKDSRWQVLYYGFDFARYAQLPSRSAARELLGLPETAEIIGHVGRFVPVKNHLLLVDAFAEVAARRDSAHLALVGDGELRPEVERRLGEHGLAERATLLGLRSDVHNAMAAFDVLAFPSALEGFGIVALEAQAAGLPVVASTGVPTDVDVIDGAVHRVSLKEGAGALGDALGAAIDAGPPLAREEAFRAVETSEFGIRACLSRLCAIYEGARRDNG